MKVAKFLGVILEVFIRQTGHLLRKLHELSFRATTVLVLDANLIQRIVRIDIHVFGPGSHNRCRPCAADIPLLPIIRCDVHQIIIVGFEQLELA